MALPLKPGLLPAEVAFLCEMELINIIPRQRLEGLELLGGPTQPLIPPFPTPIPLWLALLLKRQKRANILPPPWLTPDSLSEILDTENMNPEAFSPAPRLPDSTTTSSDLTGSRNGETKDYLDTRNLEMSNPFLESNTSGASASALPYHFLELSHLLLTNASDDIEDADTVRRLIRDLREVRMAKLRKGISVLDAGAGVQMNGVGGLEIAESRGFIGGVVDGLRMIGASREQMRRERDEENGIGGGGYGRGADDGSDDDML